MKNIIYVISLLGILMANVDMVFNLSSIFIFYSIEIACASMLVIIAVVALHTFKTEA